jgi:hypothetical protein
MNPTKPDTQPADFPVEKRNCANAQTRDWQPIETAPTDREIWAFNGEQARMIWSQGNQWALWIWADELLSEVDPSPEQPTHWMPLPAAPVESAWRCSCGSPSLPGVLHRADRPCYRVEDTE